MEIRPDRRLGLAVGSFLFIVDLTLAGVLALRVLSSEPTLLTLPLAFVVIGLVGAAAVLGYWTYGLVSLSYRFRDGYLTIRWAGITEQIPLAKIDRVLTGAELGHHPRISGLNWPGHHIGLGRLPGIGPARFYSAHRSTEELVCLVAQSRDAYVLSAPDATRIKEQIKLGAEFRDLPHQITPRWGLSSLTLFRDHVAFSLVLVAFLADLLLFAFGTWKLPFLPELLPLHFTATGEVDRIGLRIEILRLPAISLTILAINVLLATLVHRLERFAAILCLVAAMIVQALFWVAFLKLVS